MSDFKWRPNEDPPYIESHSKAKLDVIASYLSEYYDTLNIRLGADEFKLDLVDGFCGGGSYRSTHGEVIGSPLIMVEETQKALNRINRGRSKKIRFNIKYHFIDKERAHTDHLKRVLQERGHSLKHSQIEIHTSPFETIASDVVHDIRSRQPRSGRSLFLLDQSGYSLVSFSSIRKIFESLPNAEVILTFAAETLRSFARTHPHYLKGLLPTGLRQQQVEEILEDNSNKSRGVLQRVLRKQILGETGATYDTPFFIRPSASRRALWFIHLSRHAKARDVMVMRHWAVANAFEHIGTGGFQMLGFDALLKSDETPLFNFTDWDREMMQQELLETMPQELYKLLKAVDLNALSVHAIHEIWANKTAATYSQIDCILTSLVQEREFDMMGKDGREKNRNRIKTVGPTDSIILPRSFVLQGLSRIDRSKND